MSERLERLERERDKLESEWGGLARYELEMLRVEINSERGSSQEDSYRRVFGCGNAFHGRKYE